MPGIALLVLVLIAARGFMDGAGSQARNEIGRAGSAIAGHPGTRKLSDRISQGRTEGRKSGWFWAWVGARGAQYAYRGARWTTSRAYRAARGDTNPGPLTRIWTAGRQGSAHARAQRELGGYEPVAACAVCGAVGLASLMTDRKCARCTKAATPPPPPPLSPAPSPSPRPSTPTPVTWPARPTATPVPEEAVPCTHCGAASGVACDPACPTLATRNPQPATRNGRGAPVLVPAPARPSWPASPALGPRCSCCGAPSNRVLCGACLSPPRCNVDGTQHRDPAANECDCCGKGVTTAGLCTACQRSNCHPKGEADCQQPLPDMPDEAVLAGERDEEMGWATPPRPARDFPDEQAMRDWADANGYDLRPATEEEARNGMHYVASHRAPQTTPANGAGATPGGNGMSTTVIGGANGAAVDAEGGQSLEGSHGVMASAIAHAKSTADALEQVKADLEENHADPDVIAQIDQMIEAAEQLEANAASADELLTKRADGVAEAIEAADGSEHVADTAWHDRGN